jgi:eukaryotic-like serine/threonine-protein kinase
VAAVDPVEKELPPGTLVLGRYTVAGKLAQGGMAEVYLARQRGPAGYQKLVVIKRVRPHLADDADFVGMFTNEARLAAMISHANVVQIFDLGDAPRSGGGSDWFLAMEYLDGRDMLQVGRACRTLNKAVPFDVTARIIADACAGLDHAHNLRGADGAHLGLVHRDMSPENVVITFDGTVKVVDFGIAKAADNAVKTMAGQIKGKLGYVAPEAIRGAVVDARADIFAVGATLYLFLCGRPAFGGTTPMEIFERSLRPPVPPREVNPRVPEALDAICMRALAQEPTDRYENAGELRAALEEYLQSTGRALGAAQLSQFMQILFPTQTDPVRARIDRMLADVPTNPGGADKPRTMSLPALAQPMPATLPPDSLPDRSVPDPVTIRTLRQPALRPQPQHLRSVSVDVDVETTGIQHDVDRRPYTTNEQGLDVSLSEADDAAAIAAALAEADEDERVEATVVSGLASPPLPQPTSLPPEFSESSELTGHDNHLSAIAEAFEHTLTSSSIVEEMIPPPVEASLPVTRPPRVATPPPMQPIRVPVMAAAPMIAEDTGPSLGARVAMLVMGMLVGAVLVAGTLWIAGRI